MIIGKPPSPWLSRSALKTSPKSQFFPFLSAQCSFNSRRKFNPKRSISWIWKIEQWKSSLMENKSYQLISAGRSTKQGQIGQHWLAGNSYFPCRRIFISCFSEPLGWKPEVSFAQDPIFYLNVFWRAVKVYKIEKLKLVTLYFWALLGLFKWF